jgi:PTH2 family peptidyl-tRNA hydrolase
MPGEIKQVIVVRNDVGLSRGKLAAQCCHAAIECFRNAKPSLKKRWLDEGQKKVVLSARSLGELIKIKDMAKKAGINFSLIADAGLTEVPPGTITCIGIGPAPSRDIDRITGSLPLLE